MTCPNCGALLLGANHQTACLVNATAELERLRATVGRQGLGTLVTQLLDEHWPDCGVNGWYLADLIRESAALAPSTPDPVAQEPT